MIRYLGKYSRRLAQGAVLWLFLFAVGSAFADNSKISPDLLPLLNNPSNQVNVIVQYSSLKTCSGGGFLGALLCTAVNLIGGLVNFALGIIDGLAGTMSAGDVITTSNQSNVNYISLDRPVRPMLDYTAAAVNAQFAWASSLDGTGVGIAVIDSGIYPHPDLNKPYSTQSRVVYRQSFVKGLLFDDYGHGTHVAGIAAGNGSSSSSGGAFRTFKGIAPNANLIDLRVLDANGMSTDSAVIAAIQQAVALKSKYNIRVINLSLGRPIYEGCNRDPLCRAVEAAWKNGIVVVTAAGNLGRNGYGTILAPGNSPHAITVGSMKTMATYPNGDDLIASYSSKGPTYIDLTVKPDVVAPGNLVDSLLAPGSTLQKQYPSNVVAPSQYTTTAIPGGPLYFTLSGTSMATPVVSGAVALMLQENPSLTPDTIKARLMKTASKSFPLTSTATDPATGAKYTDSYDIFTIGAGYLNLAGALQDTDTVSYPALSPQVTYNHTQQSAYLVRNSSSAWWTNPSTSTSAVWGTTVLIPATSAIWGSSAVWGTSTDWGTSAVWGTSGDWGTSAVWGTSNPGATSAVWGTTTGIGER
jgi:serine protease AprX